ncbi:hypothetical protein E1200_21995 [Actinomadura sp. GC306]|uniref:hypothetical protein n=1 Tax=Actinomadura sp. GC306 TaxID=2530367 RepID=UPI00104B26C1|nr:hypothetical protein [Actinomadura sp. GC306]TDC63554.1 hypothetical protein E1200_21995 [Actinomadura sp. GC306]
MITPHDLLTPEPLEGPTAITRVISPQAVARLVHAEDWADAVAAVQHACSDWGGACSPILPVAQGAESLAAPWKDLLADSNTAEVHTRGVLPVPKDYRAEYGGMWRDGDGFSNLLSVLVRLPEQRVPSLEILDVNALDPDNPWYLAYLGIWGLLQQEFEVKDLEFLGLRDGLTFSDVVKLAASTDQTLGPEHLLESLRGQQLTARQLSCVGLSVAPAPIDQSLAGDRLLPFRREQALKVGPNVVVVYEPGSVEDLCLLWQLRAAHAFFPGFPLAVPVTTDVAHALSHWRREFAMKAWQLHGGGTCFLVSASVSREKLQALAEKAGGLYYAADYREVLQPSWGCGYWTQETANFTSGHTRVPSLSPSEHQWFGTGLLTSHGVNLDLTIIPEQWDLPPSRTMRQALLADPRYHRGVVRKVSRRREFVEISYITGLDVMHAAAQDQNADCAPSEPGVIAESVLKDIGFPQLYPLLSPNVQELLVALCERRGSGYWKRKLRTLLKDDSEQSPEGRDRLTRIEEMLRQDAGVPDEFDQVELTFGRIKKYFGGDGATKAWLDWADTHGLILRGAGVSCPRCKGRAWHPLAELSPPITCRGCGNPIKRPFGYDHLPFAYRASELLLRLMSTDALVHVLAQRFFAELFRQHFGGIGPIFGGYPGVNFMERGSSRIFGEADVLLLLADGSIAVGECKTRAAGLVAEELEKLAGLAARLDASFTFVATLDSSEACGDNWRRNPHADGRLHFALTAEHLYDLHPRALIGTDPFAWRTQYAKFGKPSLSVEEHKEAFAKHLVAMRERSEVATLPWWRGNDE